MTRLDEIKKWQGFTPRMAQYGKDIEYLLSLVEKQAQTIRAIRSLCLDPKEKDGCQTVASQVVRLCDEALEGK